MYAPNQDKEPESSIISKLTSGEVKVLGEKIDMWTFDETQKTAYALLETLNVRTEVNQVKGRALSTHLGCAYLTDPR